MTCYLYIYIDSLYAKLIQMLNLGNQNGLPNEKGNYIIWYNVAHFKIN